MSISAKQAKEYANSFAVSCCRFEVGTIIDISHLENPEIFSDLEESGLLSIPKDCNTIGQVLGAALIKTIDPLTPITPEYVGNLEPWGEKAEISEVNERTQVSEQTIKIHIGEGKDITFEMPTSALLFVESSALAGVVNVPAHAPEKIIRSLKRKHFKIDNINFGDETKIEGTTLTLRNPAQLCKEAALSEELVVNVGLEIITPDKYSQYSETIMDVLPIACKESGELGSGVSRVIDGAVLVLTGTDSDGVQIGEFGSSEGEMATNIMWGRPGAPDLGDILIKVQVTIKAGSNMERPGPLAAHKASDYIADEIRKALKEADESLCVFEDEFVQARRPGKPKVVIVKEIMGQGAMHDNLILPFEPVGVLGGIPNVDLGNLPIVLSPAEVFDGAIHALTCIGPASKETSRHYFREPLILEAMHDDEIDLAGVIFIGSPQANSEKLYVSKRLGMMVEAMDIDGAIVTTEGFGNNHIDFASHIEQIGERGVAAVGVSYSAMQGALVVGNKYMQHMIDLNKSEKGVEDEILCNNTLTHEDAVRAMYMLKSVLSGESIRSADKQWSKSAKMNNIAAIEKITNKKIDLVPNEQSLHNREQRG